MRTILALALRRQHAHGKVPGSCDPETATREGQVRAAM
jgi:hypothetical protein